MEHETYVRRANEASALVEKGEYPQAIEILRSLVESDLALTDKAMMCLNIAIVYDRMGDTDEALHWYDRGMAYEHLAGGRFVEEHRAAYLAEKGRIAESLLAYKSLLARSGLTEQDKARIEHNVHLLEERLAEKAS